VKVAFCRSRTLASWVVRVFSWSSWSHTAILTDDGRVLEAVWPRVREITHDAFQADNTVVKIVELPCSDPASAVAWARAQVGKRYDLLAVVGFAFHRTWTDTRQWFCSEFVAMAFGEGHTPLFRDAAIHRVTPQDLWELPGVDL
jgi:uncharacterized protein YycO